MSEKIVYMSVRFVLLAVVLSFAYAKLGSASGPLAPIPAIKPAAGVFTGIDVPLPAMKPVLVSQAVPVPAPKPQKEESEKSGSFFGIALFDAPVPAAKPSDVIVRGGDIVPVSKPMPVSLEPISEADIAVYRRIFALQAAGKITAADKEFSNLTDFRLRGHVLFQRYMHPTAYRTSFEELRNWMEMYADLPRADKIYNLALSRMPKDFKGHLNKPQEAKGVGYLREPTVERGKIYRTTKRRTHEQDNEVKKLQSLINRDISRNSPTSALRRLKSGEAKAYMDAVEIDTLKANIARGYIHAGKPREALELAAQAASRSGAKEPLAGWIAGQANWRMGRYDRAASYFEVAASSEYSSGWMKSAAAFWASRAHMRSGKVREVSRWLREAASHSHTFYGLIAARALGRNYDFNWDIPPFSEDYYTSLASHPAGLRAIALAEAGQVNLAEAELMRLDPHGDEKLKNAMLSYAGFAGLPGLAFRLGNSLQPVGGGFYDAALYPKGPWRAHHDYNIDDALIHAIMRQESRFDPMAESRSGAKGLMQLMPTTASYVSGNREYRDKQHQHKLLDPETNLEIGQRYLADLLKLRQVDGDLFSLLVAYNAGPGNLNKWKNGAVPAEDPLLFIESIPVAETRSYVERVLANYWIYRLRDGQRTPSLDAVAKGQWARYAGRADDEKDRNKKTRLAQQDFHQPSPQAVKVAYRRD